MESVKICFDNADEVWKFVNTIRKFDGEYDLAMGSYTVDAKSILEYAPWEPENHWN